MRNGACVTWLLGWWLIQDIGEYLYFLEYGKPFEVTSGYAFFIVGIWILFTSILYEKKDDHDI